MSTFSMIDLLPASAAAIAAPQAGDKCKCARVSVMTRGPVVVVAVRRLMPHGGNIDDGSDRDEVILNTKH